MAPTGMAFGPVMAAVVLAMLVAPASSAPPAPVTTTSGQVQGVRASGGVTQYLGIPFAEAPVGDLRFRSPVAKSPWDGVFNATALMPDCPQLRLLGNLSAEKHWSEDCLGLDVFVPDHVAPGAPVLAFIHGGGFFIGSDFHNGELNGTHLAATYGVVVVSVSYRLDVLGFLAHAALRAEDAHNSTGNLGVQDQRLALQWVHNNAAAFGGNASNVLLFGQSAGAFSVCYHLASPASAGLFAGVIMESGQCDSPSFFPPLDNAMAFGADYAAAMGCNATQLGDAAFLKCLRAKPVMDLLAPLTSWFSPDWPNPSAGHPLAYKPKLAPVMPWGPAVDGTKVGTPVLPLAAIQSGAYNRVPVIAGTNADEGTIFVPLFVFIADTTYPLQPDGVTKLLVHMGLNATQRAQVQALYPQSVYHNANGVGAAIVRDVCLACPTRRLHRAIANGSGPPSYMYRYTAEIRYVWGTPKKAFTTEEAQVSHVLQSYWVNMATSGSPNNGPVTVPAQWPVYATGSDEALRLNTNATVIRGVEHTACDYWDTYPINMC